MSWKSPTGHIDPSGTWSNETNAYDDDITTFATGLNGVLAWSDYLELTISVIRCDRIRVWRPLFGGAADDQYDVDVFDDVAWHDVYQGAGTSGIWNVHSLGIARNITKIRVRYYNSSPILPGIPKAFEFSLWGTHMSLADTNVIVRTYLLTPSAITNPLIALIGDKLHCPRLPKNATLPAISFFTRGGFANRFRKSAVSPSIQFDCWADNLIDAREVYRSLYDALHSIGNADVTIAGKTYYIIEAREEVQGQDLVDVEIPNYFRVLTFYQITIRDDL